MSKKRLAIYGAGGLGRELKAWTVRLHDYEFIGFFDDSLSPGSLVDGSKVIGNMNNVASYNELHIIIGIGDPRTRKKVADQLATFSSLKFPVMIHPKAIVENPDDVKIGEGTVITAGCILTTGISIGRHVLINLNCSVGHDCIIDDCSCVMPGVNISGAVTIGKSVLIGTGASILNNLSVGDRSKIGAGSVVLKSLPENCTAVGVPAKIISS